MTLKLEEMTTEKKLRAMEALWDDICWSTQDLPSPPWHEDILKKREQGLNDDKDRFVDWNQAKKDIRDSIS